MTTVDFPLKPGQAPVRFRFTIPNTRALELAAGCGIELLRLRGQTVHALVLMTCYGLRWSDKRMTEEKAGELIQEYLEADGSVEALSKALVKAMNESGVYGEPEKPETEGGDDPDPPTVKPETTVM